MNEEINALRTFTFEEQPVRTLLIDNVPWFVGKDVAKVLGYTNPLKAIRDHVDVEDKGVNDSFTPGGKQKMTIIDESGVYSLIFASKLPGAKAFKRWVTSEVLPAIRATGTYSVPAAAPATDAPSMTTAQLLAAQAQLMVDMEKRIGEIDQRSAKLSERTARLEDKVDRAVSALTVQAPQGNWRAEINVSIVQFCESNHLNEISTRGELYKELEVKTGCSVNRRLDRLRERRVEAGMKRSEAATLTKLDAVADDRQLRTVFECVLRLWQAKYALIPVKIQLEDFF